jgi:hypothetical protein
MTNEDLQAYFHGLGLGGEIVAAADGARFIVGREYLITKGSLSATL